MYIAYVKEDTYSKDIYGLEKVFETKDEAKEFIVNNLKSNTWTYGAHGMDICVGDDNIIVIDDDFDETRIDLHFQIAEIQYAKNMDVNKED